MLGIYFISRIIEPNKQTKKKTWFFETGGTAGVYTNFQKLTILVEIADRTRRGKSLKSRMSIFEYQRISNK